jgi:hypothetical protein
MVGKKLANKFGRLKYYTYLCLMKRATKIYIIGAIAIFLFFSWANKSYNPMEFGGETVLFLAFSEFFWIPFTMLIVSALNDFDNDKTIK